MTKLTNDFGSDVLQFRVRSSDVEADRFTDGHRTQSVTPATDA